MNNALRIDAIPSCTLVDPELFFPVSKVDIVNNLRIVKPICNGCPIFIACGQYAKDYPELQGIWAGKYRTGVGFKSGNLWNRKELNVTTT